MFATDKQVRTIFDILRETGKFHQIFLIFFDKEICIEINDRCFAIKNPKKKKKISLDK